MDVVYLKSRKVFDTISYRTLVFNLGRNVPYERLGGKPARPLSTKNND